MCLAIPFQLVEINGSVAVGEALKVHAGNAEQADDITMMGLRYLGSEPS